MCIKHKTASIRKRSCSQIQIKAVKLIFKARILVPSFKHISVSKHLGLSGQWDRYLFAAGITLYIFRPMPV